MAGSLPDMRTARAGFGGVSMVAAMMVFFAIMMPVVILICGLSIDVGLLELRRAQMQSAADAAALSAELEAERGTGNWVNLGLQDAASSGFADGSNNVTVTVQQFATSGTYAGRYDGLQVGITQNVKTIFMGTLNHGMVTVGVQSVALITPCIYLLGTGKLQSPTLIATSGALSSTPCAINVNGGMTITSPAHVEAEAWNITGPSSSTSGSVYPPPNYNAAAMSDPLAYLASPSFSSCNYTSYSKTSGSATLSPGTYCKGMSLSGGSTITLNPGLYIITGGAAWSNTTVNGSGVTLYFTTGGGASYGQFKISSSATVNLSAAADASGGAVPGVLVFADRAWVHTSAQDFICSSSTFKGDGIWYLTGAGLSLQTCGTFTGTHYSGIVADNISMAGTNLYPGNDYEYVTAGNPFRRSGALVQ